MKYSKMLRELFSDISLSIEDLLLLESFQIDYLPERVPQKEFAAVIRKYPFIKNFLILRNPSIQNFINSILDAYEETKDENLIRAYCEELLWEIADLMVYNKHPEIYDKKADFNWSVEEIIAKEFLAGKLVTDVGAGSGMLTFLLAKFAKTVFAIEPITSFRNFMREKAKREKFRNVFVMDGFLDSIPFPNNSFDLLFTSNAIGWNIENELQEIERVIKPYGQAIHIMRDGENLSDNPVHNILISSDWKYDFFQFHEESGTKIKYVKTIH